MSFEKFQSLLREKLGLDQESLKRDLKVELKEEILSEFSKKLGGDKREYIDTYVDSLRGEREIEESRESLIRNRGIPSLSRLSKELDILEKRLERRAYPD